MIGPRTTWFRSVIPGGIDTSTYDHAAYRRRLQEQADRQNAYDRNYFAFDEENLAAAGITLDGQPLAPAYDLEPYLSHAKVAWLPIGAV